MKLAFAGHLGLRSPDRPLLRHLADSGDPVRQVGVCAAHGLAGVFDNFLLTRGPAAWAQMGAEVRRLGLRMGSFVHGPARWQAPDWVTGAALDTLDETRAAAERSGGGTVTCITGRVADQPAAAQRRAMADTLARAADRLAGTGIVLCVEPTHPAYAPGLLVEQVEDALEVIARADHPQVKLCLDLGHVALHGRDPVAAIRLAAGRIGTVQLADAPGRVEPGAGTLDWPAILNALDAVGPDCLLEVECEPAEPGEAGERALLARIARLADAQNEKPMSTP